MHYRAVFDPQSQQLTARFPELPGRYADLLPLSIRITETQFQAMQSSPYWRLRPDGGIESYVPEATPETLAQIRARTRCAAWQFRRALNQLDWRAAVEAAVMAAGQDVMDMWEYATTMERLHPMMAQLAAAVNKTDAEIDAVFDLALTFQE